MRFRLGCADIAVNTGRFQVGRHKKARAERSCPCCSSGQAEDEAHVMFECAAHSTIRRSARYTALFNGVALNDMKTLFGRLDNQSLLADFVFTIAFNRKQLTAAPVHV